MTKLFGTDGIRAVAGDVPPRSPLGPGPGPGPGLAPPRRRASSRASSSAGTPASPGAWMEGALVRGLGTGGGEAVPAGVLPTSAVSYLTRKHAFAAGIVLSASHNPYHDNGIKIFSSAGTKIGEAWEDRLEEAILRGTETGRPDGPAVPARAGFVEEYAAFLEGRVPRRPCGRRGSASSWTARTARARSSPRGFSGTSDSRSSPSTTLPTAGTSIGTAARSIPQSLAAKVRETGAAFGVAYDGDADRAVWADETGRVLNGDHTLFVQAAYMSEDGRLRSGRVVATTMSNMGLEIALRERGHRARPDPGRRQVRPRGDGPARRQPRRRAVRPHDLPRRLPDRGRHPHLPQDGGGDGRTGRARSRTSSPAARSSRRSCSTSGSRGRPPSTEFPEIGAGVRRDPGRARRGRPHRPPLFGHRAPGPDHGRGAGQGRDRKTREQAGRDPQETSGLGPDGRAGAGGTHEIGRQHRSFRDPAGGAPGQGARARAGRPPGRAGGRRGHRLPPAERPPPHQGTRPPPPPRGHQDEAQHGDGRDRRHAQGRPQGPARRRLARPRAARGADDGGRPRRRREPRRSRPRSSRSSGRPESRVSIFIDPDLDQIRAAATLGVDLVEINTGIYADLKPGRPGTRRSRPIKDAAELAAEARARGPRRPRPRLPQRPPHRRHPADRGAQHRVLHRRPGRHRGHRMGRPGDEGAPG